MPHLVFDLGTSGGKSAVIDDQGKMLALRKEVWRAKESPGIEAFGKEFDPDEVKTKLISCARHVLKESRVRPQDVKTIASTSLRFGYVFLDAEDHVVYFGSNMDGRGFFEQGTFFESVGDQTQETTGLYPPMLFCLPKLLWFKENSPSLYQRISKVMNLNDWWLYTLSGAFLSDYSSASTTGVFDIRRWKWSDEMLRAFGLDPALLPKVVDSGSTAGVLKEEFRQSLELARPEVVVAGPDTQCGLLGSGCLSSGEIGVVAGATSPCQAVTDSLPAALGKKLLVGAYLLPGKYVLESNAGPCGLLYDWAVRAYFGSADDPYSAAEQMISKTERGPTTMLSFVGGQIMLLDKMHVLKPSVTVFPSPVAPGQFRADGPTFVKAVIEELCYAVGCNIDAIESFMGREASSLKLTGGMTRSAEFLRIASDVCGRDAYTSLDPNATLVGVALCGMVCSGEYRNIEEAGRKTTLVGLPVHPDGAAQEYLETKQKWKDLYFKLLDLTEEGAL